MSCSNHTRPEPNDEKIRSWLEGNFYRCTGYEGIERAVKSAIQKKQTKEHNTTH